MAVKRKLFLRVVTIYMAIVLLVYLGNLLRVRTARNLPPESLGLLAAMWGFRQLVVPEGIHIFPTLIDYAEKRDT